MPQLASALRARGGQLALALEEVALGVPAARQKATQSPSVFRRSSWIQLRLGLAIDESL